MGRVEVAFDGTLPLLGLADVPGSHLLAGITRLTQTQCFATDKESARFICVDGATKHTTIAIKV